MTKKFLLTSAITMGFLWACTSNTQDATVLNDDLRDWCFSGGSIYTAIDTSPQVDVLAVKDGEIVYVGKGDVSESWCEDNAGPDVRNIDLGSGALYPGFTDGHGHLIGIGLREMTLNLEGTASIKELQSRVKAVVDKTSKGETIYGRGWIETHWPEKRFPNRNDLDVVAPNNPVILERADGHAVVVNSAAIENSKITRDTENPFGGAINKDEKGEPNGMLIDNAAKLIDPLMPTLTPERKEEAYIKGANLYASRGWANIHSMSVDPDDIALLERLASEGKIKIRVYNAIDLLEGRDMPGASVGQLDNSNLVTTRAIKLYADGALGSRGAALLAPYNDDAGNMGLMTLKKGTAISILTAALRNGTQVNTHAIGDKANREVLNWYEEAFATVPKSDRKVEDPRWRIEHSQILSLDDLQRFKALGVLPSMQPSHAIGDLHFAVDRLGKKRLAGGYAWRNLVDSGSIIIGGSDAPVEVGDPRIEFYAATQRKDLEGYNNEAWYPEQKVTPQEALKMFTIWPAIGAFEDKKLGTLEVGKSADFTIFEQDLMTVSGLDILDAKVKMTIVDGDVAYER